MISLTYTRVMYSYFAESFQYFEDFCGGCGWGGW
jgi:hypothetical protein